MAHPVYFHNTPLLNHILKPHEFNPYHHNSLFRSFSLFFWHLFLRLSSYLFLPGFRNIGKHFLSLWCFLQGYACYVIRLILMRYFTVRKNVTLFLTFLGKPYMLIRHHMTILLLLLVLLFLLLLQSALQPLVGFWPTQLSLSILSTKVLTECRCQRNLKPLTWRTSD